MSPATFLEKFLPRRRWAFAAGVGLALTVLAATILAGPRFVRGLVRQQVAQRDAEALYAATRLEQLHAPYGNGQELRDEIQVGFDAAVLASRMRGVMGLRFYEPEGRLKGALPANILTQPLDSGARRAVQARQPSARPYPARCPIERRVH